MTGTHIDSPSTDFAITSVNVPDRLDQREVDDRKRQDEEFYAQRGVWLHLRVWSRRLLPYLFLIIIVALAGTWLAEEREALGPGRISQRMSAALRVPVHLQDTRLRTSPAPALVLTGVDLGGQVHLGEVALEFTAPSLWRALISGQRRWGDIVIAPLTLNLDQATQLLAWFASLDKIVPDSATIVRVSELRLAGTGLLPGRFEAVARRDPTGKFTSVTLRTLDGRGSMQLQLTPDPAAGVITFQCDGADWRPPFAPHTAWTEALANGKISGGAIEIERFNLGSGFGAIQGHLLIHQQEGVSASWAATGEVSTVGVDLPTLMQQILKPGKAPDESESPGTSVLSGTAAIEATLTGLGATPEEALSRMMATGSIKVRSAELNGINLGYAASHPPSGSGNAAASTRFTELETSFVSGSSGVLFRNIHGVAGAMSTRGELAVTPDLALDGLIHVNLGGARIQAPLRMHIRGTLSQPKFGR